jgi:diguanylate cyclase (GGDEF)-like protein/PAS domain S-box-containing protein
LSAVAAVLDAVHGLQSVLGATRSLRSRLMLATIAGTVVFSAAAAVVVYRVSYSGAIDRSTNTLHGLVQAVEKTLAIGVFASDRVLLKEVARGLASSEWVAQVQVYSTAGELIAGAKRKEVPSQSATPVKPIFLETPLYSPFEDSERVGTVRIEADIENLSRSAKEVAYAQASFMVGQAVLAALLMYIVAEALVSKPIRRLARELQKISVGTSDVLAMVELHRHDEIGALVNSANALLTANASALQREREQREEIANLEAQYRQIFDSSSAGIFVLNMSGTLINSNPTVARTLGIPQDHLAQLETNCFIDQAFRHPHQFRKLVADSLRLGMSVSDDLELVSRGDLSRWVHCMVSAGIGNKLENAFPGVEVVEGVIYDVTERKAGEAEHRLRVEHDALTGLKSRFATEELIERMLVDVNSRGSTACFMYIDLDGFKAVNDILGHNAGDQVLVAVAERMRCVVRRASDVIGRIGGDEFVIGMPDVSPSDPIMTSTASALIDALSPPVLLESGALAHVGVSVGIACSPHNGTSFSELMGAADSAMYWVKRNGKNAFSTALWFQPQTPLSVPVERFDDEGLPMSA